MAPQAHELYVSLVSGEFVATCRCGQWRHAQPFHPNQHIAKAIEQIKDRHAQHVADAAQRD